MKNKELIFRGLQPDEVVNALARREPTMRHMVSTAIAHNGLAPVLAELQTLELVLECTADDARTRAELADASRVSPGQLCEQLMSLAPNNMAWDLVPLSVAIAAILKRGLEVMQQVEAQRNEMEVAAAYVDSDEDTPAGDDDLQDMDLDSLNEGGEEEDDDESSNPDSVLPVGSVRAVGAFCEKLREELSLLFFAHDDTLPLPTRSDAAQIQNLEVDSGCIELLSSLLQLLERSPREGGEDEGPFEAVVADHSFLVPAMVGEWIDALLGVVHTAPLQPPPDGPVVEQVPDL